MIRVLIAEDEPLARRRLMRLLDARADVEIAGTAKNGEEAVRLIAELRPDLVFLDIHMPELSGFEVLSAISDGPMPAVIFTTAHDEYAVKAFEVHALDYLLKPFDSERLDAAVDRAAAIEGRTADFLHSLSPPRRFVVRTPGRIVFLQIGEIDWVEAADNYVQLHAGAHTHLMRGSLKALEKQLGSRFARVHRSAIVNLDAVVELVPRSHGDYEIVLRSGHRLIATRTHAGKLRRAARP